MSRNTPTPILFRMHIIVAPDSFKGTASATQAAAAIAGGLRAALPDATITTLPMADGGEGTAEILANAAALFGAEVQTITLPTTDAVGRLTEASYYLAGEQALIDVASATGLPAVADALNPLHSDSYGTGVLIADAESRGAKQIVLCLGGSATIDGGMGILAALGAAAHDDRGYALPKGGAPLVRLASIDTAQLNIKAGALDYTLLADTRAIPVQAATMYGPQKGAEGEQVALLAGALLRLCEVTGVDEKADPSAPQAASPLRCAGSRKRCGATTSTSSCLPAELMWQKKWACPRRFLRQTSSSPVKAASTSSRSPARSWEPSRTWRTRLP